MKPYVPRRRYGLVKHVAVVKEKKILPDISGKIVSRAAIARMMAVENSLRNKLLVKT